MSDNPYSNRPPLVRGQGKLQAQAEAGLSSIEHAPPPVPGPIPEPDLSEADPVQTCLPDQKTQAQKFQGLFAPVSAGLVLATLDDPGLKSFVTHVVLGHVSGQEYISNIPIKSGCTNVTTVYNGSSRGFEAHKLFTDPAELPPGVEYEAIHCSEDSDFSWHSPEGLQAAKAYVDKSRGGILILTQDCAGVVSAEMAFGFRPLDNEAKEKGVVVVLLLVCSDDRYKKARLSKYCSEYVNVETCEPDIGQNHAFAFDCYGYRQLGHLGLPKMMCSVKFDQEQVAYSFEPFVSTRLDERIIWMMRAHGMTLEEIGLTLKKNKTTILRRLQGVKGPDMRNVDRDWLETKLAAFSEVD